MMQNSLFDLQNRYASLSAAGDSLERLNAVIDWELFRPLLDRIDIKERKNTSGRKPTCRILMFKLLILQRLHNLSDERLQYPVSDRLSFMRFLGLELSGNVPDARTVWAFREALKKHKLVDALFERFNQALAALGVDWVSNSKAARSSMPPLCRSRFNATGARPTPSSRPMPCPSTGERHRTNGHRRMSMPAGQKRADRITAATRTTSLYRRGFDESGLQPQAR